MERERGRGKKGEKRRVGKLEERERMRVQARGTAQRHASIKNKTPTPRKQQPQTFEHGRVVNESGKRDAHGEEDDKNEIQ